MCKTALLFLVVLALLAMGQAVPAAGSRPGDNNSIPRKEPKPVPAGDSRPSDPPQDYHYSGPQSACSTATDLATIDVLINTFRTATARGKMVSLLLNSNKNETTAIFKLGATTGASNPVGLGECSSNADCPAKNPICSEYGYCQCSSYRVGGPACSCPPTCGATTGHHRSARSVGGQDTCKTVTGTPCAFPFKYNGIVYNECTTADWDEPWCSTAGGDGWGVCASTCFDSATTGTGQDACQTVTGTPCAFPFTYNGMVYNKCTTADSNEPWCFTAGGDEWGFCASTCFDSATTGTNDKSSGTNDKSYCDLGEDHIMCRHGAEDHACANKRWLNEGTRRLILDQHNNDRRRVAKGIQAGQPSASNMRELIWDDELERIAQRWADQCTFQHSTERRKLDGTSVGENLAWSWSSEAGGWDMNGVRGMVKGWYDEVDMFGGPTSAFSSGTGHYSQMVWATTDRVGCGIVSYEDGGTSNLLVCSYAEAGNMMGTDVYKQGRACGACPAGTMCADGLCRRV